jgi:hypothetical protein
MDAYGMAPGGAKLGPGERRQVALVLTGALIALAAASVVAAATDATTADLFRDPVGRADRAALTGVMTIIGVIAWAAAAATALLRASLTAPGHPLRAFLIAAGTLTGLACLDDLLRGHENIGHVLTGEDDGELLVLAAFGLLALALLLRFREVIRSRTPIALLAGAGVLLGFSAGLDVVSDVADVTLPSHYLVEDGPKFVGILMWATYLAIVSRRAVGTRPIAPGRGSAQRALPEPDPP